MHLTKRDLTGPSFDAETVSTLKEILREEFEIVLQSFFRSTHVYADQIRTGIVQNDREAVRHAAHKLGSSAGQMGFMKVSWLARTIEENCNNDDLLELLTVHMDLNAACAEALVESQTICQQD